MKLQASTLEILIIVNFSKQKIVHIASNSQQFWPDFKAQNGLLLR